MTGNNIQETEIKQNKQPNNGQCCLFIVGVLTGFGHAMTFFKMKNKCQVVLKYKKTDRHNIIICLFGCYSIFAFCLKYNYLIAL